MLFVVTIIVIALAVVGPMIDGGINSREVKRAARQIASTMHYLRGEAVAKGLPTAMRIDQHENTIETVGGGRWAALSERAAIESVKGAIPAGDEVWDVRFFPNGSTTGAEIVVVSSQDHTQHRWSLTLDPLLDTIHFGEAPL
jgi:general secretion pathway protein H